MTQALERLQNDLATTERNRSKREAKAVKLRIQREKDEKRDRAEQEERREETRKVDKEKAKTNRRKDKGEAEECNIIAQKEVENRIDEANKRPIEQQQSTNLLLSKMVEMQSDTIVQAADTQRQIEERRKRGVDSTKPSR